MEEAVLYLRCSAQLFRDTWIGIQKLLPVLLELQPSVDWVVPKEDLGPQRQVLASNLVEFGLSLDMLQSILVPGRHLLVRERRLGADYCLQEGVNEL